MRLRWYAEHARDIGLHIRLLILDSNTVAPSGKADIAPLRVACTPGRESSENIQGIWLQSGALTW